MNPTFEGPKITTPQEELSRLREVADRHAERAKENGVEITPNQAVHEVVKRYAETTASEVLHPDYELKEHETQEIVLQLTPTPSS